MANNIYNGTFVLGDTSATTLSAGEGIKLDTSVPGIISISNDETVLWEDLTAGQILSTSSYNLSEPFTAFEKIAVAGAASYGGIRFIKSVYTDQVQANGGMAISVGEWGMGQDGDQNFYCDRTFLRFSTANAGVLTATSPGSRFQINTSGTISTNASRAGTIQRIIGINRKQTNGGN